jgi:hypothetical protein
LQLTAYVCKGQTEDEIIKKNAVRHSIKKHGKIEEDTAQM